MERKRREGSGARLGTDCCRARGGARGCGAMADAGERYGGAHDDGAARSATTTCATRARDRGRTAVRDAEATLRAASSEMGEGEQGTESREGGGDEGGVGAAPAN